MVSKYPASYFKFKKQLLKKVGAATCYYCQTYLNQKDITLDHIIPLSKGGDLKDRENIIFCCVRCNQLKSNLDFHEFMAIKDQMLLNPPKSKFPDFSGPEILANQIISVENLVEPRRPEAALIFTKDKILLSHGYAHGELEKQLSLKISLQFCAAIKNSPAEKSVFIIKHEDRSVYYLKKGKQIWFQSFSLIENVPE